MKKLLKSVIFLIFFFLIFTSTIYGYTCNTGNGDYCLGQNQFTCNSGFTVVGGGATTGADTGCGYNYIPGGGGPNGVVDFYACCRKNTNVQNVCIRLGGTCEITANDCSTGEIPYNGSDYGCNTNVCCIPRGSLSQCQVDGGTCMEIASPRDYQNCTRNGNSAVDWPGPPDCADPLLTCCISLPACTGSPSYGPWDVPYNTCYANNANRAVVYQGPQPCDSVGFTQSSTIYNCDAGQGYTYCSGGTCQRDCNTGAINCTAWSTPANTCNTNNASRTCTHNSYNNVSNSCVQNNFTDRTTIDNCSNNYACTAGTCYTTLTVNVFEDDNHNGVKDAGEPNYPGISVSRSGGGSGTTDASGNVTFTNLIAGTYTITITKPANTAVSLPVNGNAFQSITLDTTNGGTTMEFGIAKYYSITGTIYNDVNQSYNNPKVNQYFDSPPDTVINSGNVTVVGNGTNLNLTTSSGISNGVYATGLSLLSGTYTVSYPTVPQGYKYAYPGTPGSFSITVGRPGGSNACDTNNYHDASCDGNGNMTGLDFGLTNELATTTFCGASVRADNGFSDPLHQVVGSGATCGSSGVSSSYVYPTIAGDATCNIPGVIYSGATDPYYGVGQASPDPYNWQAGDGTYTENFGITNNCPTIVTSYSYVAGQIASRIPGNPYQDLSLYCNIYDCTLPQDVPNGIYKITPGGTPMVLHAMNFPSGKNWVFLVNGNLTIDGRMLVPSDSTLTIVSSGNITITGAVGNAAIDNFDANIQGYYSADGTVNVGSVSVDGNGACDSTTGAARDKKLVTTDSIVVNAACNGGSMVNNRTLCVSDLTCSVIHMSIGKGNISGTLPEAGNGIAHLLNMFSVRPILQRRDFEQEITP